jgi:hypothetical protein
LFNGHLAPPIPPIIALNETEVVPPNRSRYPLSSTSDEDLKAAYTNLTYCERFGTGDASNSALCASGVTRITGIYPRRGLTFLAAAVGGLLAPIVLLVASAYVVLTASSGSGAASRPDTPPPIHALFAKPKPTDTSSDGKNPPSESRGSDPRAARGEGLYRTVAIAGVVAPLFWVIDMPSMLLMMGRVFLDGSSGCSCCGALAIKIACQHQTPHPCILSLRILSLPRHGVETVVFTIVCKPISRGNHNPLIGNGFAASITTSTDTLSVLSKLKILEPSARNLLGTSSVSIEIEQSAYVQVGFGPSCRVRSRQLSHLVKSQLNRIRIHLSQDIVGSGAEAGKTLQQSSDRSLLLTDRQPPAFSRLLRLYPPL